MLNQIILIGKVNSLDDNMLEVKVSRPKDSCIPADEFWVILPDDMSNQMHKYTKEGDIIGIKGHLENWEGKTIIKAEKITFLSTNQKED